MTPEDVFNVLDAMPALDKWIKIEDGSWVNFGCVSRVSINPYRSDPYEVHLVLSEGPVILRSGFETRNQANEFIDSFMKEMTE